MKKNYLLLLLILCTVGFAQIPAGYYNTSTGSGYTLKTQLYNIIKGHKDNGYSGLWTTYSTSDRDGQYENDNSIIDVYSENPNGADPYVYNFGTNQCGTYSVEGNCYNREHIIPQSTFNSAAPLVSDAHFIPPTDGKVNSIRSNYPHGMVNSPTTTSRNGSKLGPNSNSGIAAGYTGIVFEPINEFKGDIARMYFYFATRYENTVATYPFAMFNGTSNQVFSTTFLNILLAWHNQDPVSTREIVRNNAIYARQNNRNPFIDHPEYVQAIWGSPTGGTDTQAPSTPSNLITTSKTTTSVALSWTGATDNVGVTGYNVYVNNVLRTTVTGLAYNVISLSPSTTYSFYIKAKDAAGNLSLSSNTLSVITSTTGGTSATELFFSEYIEGSSNNKALEITNNTPNSISMAAYSIKKQTNGAGAWSAGLALSGTLLSGKKITIVNNLIASTCYTGANISSAATEMTFNGNDAVGLFKNGVLIDVIGTFNGGTVNFAADETLRRKATVTGPTTTFNKTAQWDVYITDTCNNLGSRSADPTIKEMPITPSKGIKIYPNPSTGNFNIDFENDTNPYSIEIYSLIGKKIYGKENVTDKTISLSNFQKGIYLVKVNKAQESYSKRIIIN